MKLLLVASLCLTLAADHQRSAALVRESWPDMAGVAREPLREWPPGECIVRAVDPDRHALACLVLLPEEHRLAWWGWVPLDENIIGRTVINRDWSSVLARLRRAAPSNIVE